MKAIPVYVGYDPREAIAFHTCANSIIRHASKPVAIIPVALNLFRDYEETHTDGSNHFIYTRFLVPHLQEYTGWAIFIDGDMIVRDDIVKLWELQNPYMDVMVVKHDYQTRMPVKYLGAKNEDYPRKNWSSVILWNCNSFPNRQLTPQFVQHATGSELHRFSWLDDERIGELPSEWNWLPDEYGVNKDAKLLHYTLGTPCFQEFADTPQGLPVPLEMHELDMVTDPIKSIFRDILKWRVDPDGHYYGTSIDYLVDQIKLLNTGNVAAVSSDDKDFKYKEKGKMYDPILQSFIQGCGGRLSTWKREENTSTPVVLRGITRRKEMIACREANRTFYYIDTGYFGNGKKKTYHRITRNDVQYFGNIIERPADRFAATGVQLKKFRPGTNILLAPPSQKLLNLYNIVLEDWLEQTQSEIKKHTDRPIVVRTKQSRTARLVDDTMEMALDLDVHCLVTFSSIAATEALLLGKPAITLGPNAASPLCRHYIADIENLYIPTLDEVEAWARHLAYCQFTEPEMRNGTAWRILNDR